MCAEGIPEKKKRQENVTYHCLPRAPTQTSDLLRSHTPARLENGIYTQRRQKHLRPVSSLPTVLLFSPLLIGSTKGEHPTVSRSRTAPNVGDIARSLNSSSISTNSKLSAHAFSYTLTSIRSGSPVRHQSSTNGLGCARVALWGPIDPPSTARSVSSKDVQGVARNMSIRRMKMKNVAMRERAKSKERKINGRTYPAPSFGVSSGFTSSIRFCIEAARRDRASAKGRPRYRGGCSGCTGTGARRRRAPYARWHRATVALSRATGRR
ncbi:hypothetical protein B0H14DRAFT_2569247 [Mycena olivaceomarginata]|nr:hypothetical protein B0H14DRAFT_2569247 [Mycena olivaceomarginata]